MVLPGLIRTGASLPANFLRNAANHVRGKQWSEAVQIYQKVIEQFGNKVAKLPADEPGIDNSGDFVLYVDDRWYCHRAIASLPAEARDLSQAGRWRCRALVSPGGEPARSDVAPAGGRPGVLQCVGR